MLEFLSLEEPNKSLHLSAKGPFGTVSAVPVEL